MLGAARAQGADVEIPSLSEARASFDEWLMDDTEETVPDDKVMMRALGLGGG